MPKLFYIAGHGAGDPGASGNRYQEAERVRALGNRLKAIGGANVILG
ncbi:N-acetylmuramoyl-L-alanine amidase, partial [Lachnospiraceae bacterium]|nr:N-acetylmuramoyl-L-alanine amidase [Lachnospiraceae bacterium]